MTATSRVVHLTFYKCASQWVRDVLADPEISSVTGFPLALEGADVTGGQWPAQPPGTFAGPIYGASYDDWIHNAGDADRAIVVMRDPRDIVVSLVFSLGYSHIPSAITRLLRSPIAAASTNDRLRIGMYILTHWSERMRSWARVAPNGREYLAVYRKLVQDPKREFASICGFLDWDVPPAILYRVIERHSFERRTGRNQGEVNPFSHHRKGVSGDWANYFDRELGAEFEASMPGLLVDLGFEQTNQWYEALPESQTPEPTANDAPGEVERLLQRLAILEDQSIELEQLRSTAEERLRDVEKLTGRVRALELRVAAPDPEKEKWLADVHSLTGLVHELQQQVAAPDPEAARRLEDIQTLTGLVHELQHQVAAPDPEAARRLEDIRTLTNLVHDLQQQVAAPDPQAARRVRDIETLTAVVHGLQEQSARRLEDVHALIGLVHRLQGQLAAPNPEAERRLQDIHALTATVNRLNEMLAEMKRIADERGAALDAITNSFSYRYGFRLVSRAGRLFGA